MPNPPPSTQRHLANNTTATCSRRHAPGPRAAPLCRAAQLRARIRAPFPEGCLKTLFHVTGTFMDGKPGPYERKLPTTAHTDPALPMQGSHIDQPSLPPQIPVTVLPAHRHGGFHIHSRSSHLPHTHVLTHALRHVHSIPCAHTLQTDTRTLVCSCSCTFAHRAQNQRIIRLEKT